MDVKDVIEHAKTYVREIYTDPDEKISNLGLEEIDFDESTHRWLITLAFSRPWNSPRTRAAEILDTLGSSPASLKRNYKVVTVDDRDGRILSMKNRIDD